MNGKVRRSEQKIATALIINNDQETTDTLSEIFLKEEAQTTMASTAKDARVILEEKQFNFDVILLDLQLPDIQGLDFLEWLKIMDPKLIIIVISSERSDGMLIQCLSKGASDFIEKPFDPEKVYQVALQSFHRQANKEQIGDMRAEIHASDWVELTAQSQIEYLGRFQRFSEILFNRRLSQKVVDDLRLAMEEFGRNAVEWGNKFSEDKQFRISYCFFPDRVVLKFEDEGEGFNPHAVPDPSKDPIAHLKRRQEEGKRPGGFGIFMMNRIMDEIFYNEKGNICIMTKYLPEEGEEGEEE